MANPCPLVATAAQTRAVAFLFLLSLASAVVLPWGGQQAAAPADQLLAVTANVLLGVLALGLVLLYRLGELLSYRWIYGWAIQLRLIAIGATPLLEDDHFRYLWDGLQSFTVGNPYRYAPADFFGDEQLPAQWQDVLSKINNPDLKTLYGPVLQYLFLVAYWLMPAEILPIQIILMLLDLGVLYGLNRAGVDKNFLLAYAVHPLILQESMSSVHPDALLGGLLFLAVLLWNRGRVFFCGMLMALACATKVSALIILPLLCVAPASFLTKQQGMNRMQAEVSWLFALLASLLLVLMVLYWPMVISGDSEWESLVVFGSDWRFNPLLFRLIDAVLPGSMARYVSALCLLAVSLYLSISVRNSDRRQLPVVLLLLLFMLMSPVVNPWYWLWLLPLAVYQQRSAVVLFCALTPISYYNSTVLAEAGWWGDSIATQPFLVPWVITLLQLLALLWVIQRKWCWFRILKP